MAKYTKTSIDFFLKLTWKEGMMYYSDIAEMAMEEKEALEEAVHRRPGPTPDVSGWHRWHH